MRGVVKGSMWMLGLLATLLWMRPALAQLSARDQRFAQEAATSNMAEIKLAKLALERGSSPQTKSMAQQMITDHSKAGAQLSQLAQREGINLPTAPTAQQKADYDRLSKLSGPAFDDAFMKQMQDDHQAAVSLFKSASVEVQNPALQSFASQTLPTLQHHQQMVGQPGMQPR